MAKSCFILSFAMAGIIIFLSFADSREIVSNYLTCPGVPEDQWETKNQLRIGVMFDLPVSGYNRTQLLIDADLEPDTSLIPGKSLLNYSSLAMAAYRRAEMINNDNSILPYHHLCLYYTFMPADFHNVARGANTIYIHNNVRQVINVLTEKEQHDSHSNLMISYNPVLSVFSTRSSFICPEKDSSSLEVFQGKDRSESLKCVDNIKDTCLEMVTTRLNVLRAAAVFVKRMGWKKFGLITTCITFRNVWVSKGNVSLGYYRPGVRGLMQMFREDRFEENELNIFVFIGDRPAYYRLLLEAYDLGFFDSHRQYVWIFVLPSLILHPSDRLDNQGFTTTQTTKVREALVGTMLLRPFEGDFTTAQTSFRRLSAYLNDAITLHAKAAENVLKDKANANQTSSFLLNRGDYDNITRQLVSITFNGSTGEIKFDKGCNRVSNTFLVLNYIPISYTGETLGRSSLTFIVERRAVVSFTPDNTTVTFYYVSNNTRMTTNRSTIVFRNGKEEIPLDRIYRKYTRDQDIVAGTLIASVVTYIVIGIGYIVWVYLRDKDGRVYNENWLYHDTDINYSLDHLGVNLMLSWLSYSGEQTVGQLNKSNTAVYIHNVNFDINDLTISLRSQILKFIDFKHENICPFIGGILQGTTITGVLYQYCTRGSLCSLILNPHIDFNKAFRYSFAMDAIKGLSYLHSQGIIHGRVKTSNCVIDQHWSLKLTDYEPTALACSKKRKNDKIQKSYVPCAVELDLKADIYNYGIVLLEMCCRETLLSCGNIDMNDLTYDKNVTESYVSLIKICHMDKKEDRPTASEIKGKLKQLDLCQFESNTVIEHYTQSLDNVKKEIETTIQEEKMKTDTVLSNYMPKEAVKAIRNKDPLPLQKYPNAIIVCFSLCDIEHVLTSNTQEQVAEIIAVTDRVIDGTAVTYGFHRLQSIGSIWTYVLANDDTQMATMQTSNIEAGMSCVAKVFHFFKEREVLQGLAIKACLHRGPLICGLIDDASPYYVTIGNSLSFCFQLLNKTPCGKMLISESVKTVLAYSYNFHHYKEIPDKLGVLVSSYLVSQEMATMIMEDCSSKIPRKTTVRETTVEKDLKFVSLEDENVDSLF